jgi:formate dehydrogenase maturation protein FdhE
VIWTWLKLALIFVGRLLIPGPAHPVFPKIDPCAMCPSCGHTDGVIRAHDEQGKPLVQHTCKVCLAKWYELPVLRTKQPALINAKTTEAKPELVKPA